MNENNDKIFLPPREIVSGAESYVKHRFLGRGGNGTTFLVTCTSGDFAGMQMVLKILHNVAVPSRTEAFLQEVATLHSLDHPGIVRIFDEGEHETEAGLRPFAVMEYMPKTVRELLHADDVDRLRAIRITLNCLSALCSIHERSAPIVHRDLKPENIFFGEAGAKIGDFGLAKELAELLAGDNDECETHSEPETTTGAQDSEQDEPIMLRSQGNGMPRFYRTPELVARARGEDVELTSASDVFQMGTIFYELLTGWNPQKKPRNVYEDIQLDLRPIWGSQGDTALALIRRMLDLNPTDRPSTRQCLDELQGIHQEHCKQLAWALGTEC